MSFLEGFAGSLGNHFSNKAALDQQAKREMASYEQKLKLAKELEKTTAVQQTVYERNGKLMARGLNSMGEPVGEERPASEWEVSQEKARQEAASLDKQKTEANIRASTLQADKDEQDMGFAPEREERDARESSARISASGASAASSAADTRYKNVLTTLTESGKLTPGSRRGSAQDKEVDREKINKGINEVTQYPAFLELTPAQQSKIIKEMKDDIYGPEEAKQGIDSMINARPRGSAQEQVDRAYINNVNDSLLRGIRDAPQN